MLVESTAVGHMPLETAGYQALHTQFKRLRKNVRALQHGDGGQRDQHEYDAEAIHDARVASRELRTLLQLLEPAPGFTRKRLRGLHARLGTLAQALGDVRDGDVLLGLLAAYEEQRQNTQNTHDASDTGNTGDQCADLRPLRDELQRRQTAARDALDNLLAAKQTRRLLRALRKLTRKRKEPPGVHPILVRHFVGSALWQRYEAILRYETDLPDASMETLHALRIACKELRYSLHLFGFKSGHEPEPVELILATLKAAQDQLGRLHDLLVAREIVRALPSTPALDSYFAALTQESDQLRAAAGPVWERLSGEEMRQALAGFIAGL
jgi:CHAD domain-containing protein